MTVARVAETWLPRSAAAFRLSNGRIVWVPAEDLDALGRACLNASVEWRTEVAALPSAKGAAA